MIHYFYFEDPSEKRVFPVSKAFSKDGFNNIVAY